MVRRVLWLALLLNALMFAVEFAAGLAAGSTALQADALDFLADAATYAISLLVVGMALAWRARGALLKGAAMALFGVWVLGQAAWQALAGAVPDAATMGAVGLAALAVNLAVALMLFRFRDGDSNLRSAWLCSRNDAIGNLAVMLAGAGVFASGTLWPDLAVALLMAGLALHAASQVIRQALVELAVARRGPQAAPAE